jgi:anti-sigma factor RsiW
MPPTPNDELTCKEIVELVTAYLENALRADERERFDAHLSGCEACTEYLAQMRLTIAAVGNLSEIDVTPSALRELQNAFRSFRSK